MEILYHSVHILYCSSLPTTLRGSILARERERSYSRESQPSTVETSTCTALYRYRNIVWLAEPGHHAPVPHSCYSRSQTGEYNCIARSACINLHVVKLQRQVLGLLYYVV